MYDELQHPSNFVNQKDFLNEQQISNLEFYNIFLALICYILIIIFLSVLKTRNLNNNDEE